jgi:hypothetical protein
MKGCSIQQLRLEFEKMFATIPKFINSTDHLHYILWQALGECNELLMRLVIHKTLSLQRVLNITNDFSSIIEAIIENTPANIQLQVIAYYTILLQKVISRSLEEEQYEVCSNIKRFSDLYFNNTSTALDDER